MRNATPTPSASTWTAPVVAETPPRYFLVRESESTWEEIKGDPQSSEFAEKLGDDRTLVAVYRLATNEFRFVCETYYADNRRLELVITQPQVRAFAMFNALLRSDSRAEHGLFDPVVRL